jgi:hypothetical protein
VHSHSVPSSLLQRSPALIMKKNCAKAATTMIVTNANGMSSKIICLRGDCSLRLGAVQRQMQINRGVLIDAKTHHNECRYEDRHVIVEMSNDNR